MKFLDLKDIAERGLELVNPTTPAKVLAAGQAARLRPGSHVVDFGCGYGEALALWASRFAITGLGIDLREQACARARRKLAELGLADRIEIVCANAAEYKVAPHAYDLAACIGATFIWGGFSPALASLKQALRPGGRVLVGEVYWRAAAVPPEFARDHRDMHSEHELLEIMRQNGLELEYVVRASQDDWDRYEAGNWQGLVAWLEENQGHPERAAVLGHLRDSQDEYFRYGREHFGWAVYVLRPRVPD
jgi:SAM-dependent methyltransferase